MALASIISRRSILKGVPAVIAVGAVPVAAMPAQNRTAQILHHAAEIERLLRETMPEGAVLEYVEWFARDGEAPAIWATCNNITYTGGGKFHISPKRSPDWKPYGKVA